MLSGSSITSFTSAEESTYRRRRSALSSVFLDGLAGAHRAGHRIAPEGLDQLRRRRRLAARNELLGSVRGEGSQDGDWHSIIGYLERLALAHAPNGRRERVSKLSNADASAHVAHVATRVSHVADAIAADVSARDDWARAR